MTPSPPPAGAPAAGPDTAQPVEEEKSDKLPPRVPWRGTSLKWEHAVTTTAIGVGRDNIGGEGEVYQMSWALLLNYFLVDQEDWRLQVYTQPSFGVELTNSDWTTTEHEPIFDDLPLAFAAGTTLYKSDDGAFVTSGSANMTFIFPTSPTSYEIGTYLYTSPRIALSQSFPLAGDDSPVFPSFGIGVNARWDHRFGAATTAVSSTLERPRMDASGTSFLSDQLSFSALASNTLREGISISFPHSWDGVELELFGGVSFAQAFKPTFETNACEVELATGCVSGGHDEDARTSFNSVGFTAGLTFFPVSEVGLALAYANASTQIGPDGERRNIFYSPDAMFVADLLISIDAIYERLTGPAREGSFVMAKNKKDRRAASAFQF